MPGDGIKTEGYHTFPALQGRLYYHLQACNSVTTFHFAKASFSAAAKICLIGILVHGNLLDDHSPRARYATLNILPRQHVQVAILMGISLPIPSNPHLQANARWFASLTAWPLKAMIKSTVPTRRYRIGRHGCHASSLDDPDEESYDIPQIV